MNVKKLTFLSIYTALLVVFAYFLKIPTPTGVVTMLDAGIFLAALNFSNPIYVAGVASGSAFIFDLLSGYPQWMFFSLIIHGLQGYLAYKKPTWLGFSLATIVMVVGYFIVTFFMYGMAGAIEGIVPNLLQNIVGIVVALLINKLMEGLKLKWI